MQGRRSHVGLSVHLLELWVVIWCTLTLQNNGVLAFNTVNRKQSDNGGCRLKDSCRPLGSHALRTKVSYLDMTEPFFFFVASSDKSEHTVCLKELHVPGGLLHIECVGRFFVFIGLEIVLSVFIAEASPCKVCDVISTRCSIWQACGRLKVLPMCFLAL